MKIILEFDANDQSEIHRAYNILEPLLDENRTEIHTDKRITGMSEILSRLEIHFVKLALKATKNQKEAAKLLNVPERTFYRRISELKEKGILSPKAIQPIE